MLPPPWSLPMRPTCPASQVTRSDLPTSGADESTGQHTLIHAPSMAAVQHWLTCPTLGFMHWASSRGRHERGACDIPDSEPWVNHSSVHLITFTNDNITNPGIEAEPWRWYVLWPGIDSKMLAPSISSNVAIIISLQTFNERNCQLSSQIWIFSICLLQSSISSNRTSTH